MSKEPKIILDDTRIRLVEGRHVGIGFAFLKKIKDNKFVAIQPMSPCKDYLNDVVYSEVTGRQFSAYGYTSKKQDIFKDGVFLCFSDCPSTKFASVNTFIDNETKLVPKSFKLAEKFMHEIEEKLGLKQLTKFTRVKPNLFMAEIDAAWVTSSFAISLWSLLARNSIYADGTPALEMLPKKCGDMDDRMKMGHVMKCLERFFEKGLPPHDFDTTEKFIHDHGIMEYELS